MNGIWTFAFDAKNNVDKNTQSRVEILLLLTLKLTLRVNVNFAVAS